MGHEDRMANPAGPPYFLRTSQLSYIDEAMMRHCLMYQGGFERNFPSLKAGATTFVGTDGSAHDIQAAPSEVTGVCVGYMEKAGKKFAAVRVQHGADDVVLHSEVILDPSRHMSHG